MAAPVIASKSAASGTQSSTTPSVVCPSGVASGSLILIATIVLKSSTSSYPTTITPPTGFTLHSSFPVVSVNDPAGFAGELFLYWKYATGADTGSYTFTCSSSPFDFEAQSFRITGGPTSGNPISEVNTAINNGNTTASPAVSLTTLGADSLLLWLDMSLSSGSWVVPSGYTNQTASSSAGFQIASTTQATAGATGSVSGSTPSDTQAAALVSLRAPGGGVSVNGAPAFGGGFAVPGTVISGGAVTVNGAPAFGGGIARPGAWLVDTGLSAAQGGGFARPGTVTAGPPNGPLVAIPQPANHPPRIELVITGVLTATATIRRHDPDGGLNGVRDAEPITLTAGGGLLFDYEMPYNQTVTYDLLDASGAVISTATAMVASAQSWLVHPFLPSSSVVLANAKLADETLPSGIVNQVIPGRTDPIPVGDGQRKTPQGQLLNRTIDQADTDALNGILAGTATLLVQLVADYTDATEWFYISPGDVLTHRVTNDLGDGLRRFTIPYTVVARPAGTVQSEWTWADVLATYTTWGDVLSHYTTWQGLLSGIEGT